MHSEIECLDERQAHRKSFLFISASIVQADDNEDTISKQVHDEETEKLRLEIQQCKEFIQTQQQLLQVSKGTHFI